MVFLELSISHANLQNAKQWIDYYTIHKIENWNHNLTFLKINYNFQIICKIKSQFFKMSIGHRHIVVAIGSRKVFFASRIFSSLSQIETGDYFVHCWPSLDCSLSVIVKFKSKYACVYRCKVQSYIIFKN